MSKINPRWLEGDFFAFISVEDSPRTRGDVLYGEVLMVLPRDKFVVRVYCASEPKAGVATYERHCLNERLSPSQMVAAAAAGWPEDVGWLRDLVAG